MNSGDSGVGLQACPPASSVGRHALYTASRTHARRAMRRNPVVLTSVICLISGIVLSGQDWPGWRGPNRDGATGKLQWRKEYAADFKGTWPQFGTSMSLVAGDGLIVALIGTNDDGAIAAYDAKSGAQKWIWKGDGPAYASPVIVEIGGVKQ